MAPFVPRVFAINLVLPFEFDFFFFTKEIFRFYFFFFPGLNENDLTTVGGEKKVIK